MKTLHTSWMSVGITTVAVALLTANRLTGQQNFGSATAVAGNTIFVGQPTNFYGPGVVYVFDRHASNDWTETTRLFAPDSVLGDGFGGSLAIAGDQLLIGAPARRTEGALHLFVRGTNDNWSATASLSDPNGQTGGGFGVSAALLNNTGFVGDPSVGRVYQLNTGDNQLDIVAVLEPGAFDGGGFGEVLSLSADRLLVGAPSANAGAGAVVVFRRGDQGRWVEEQVLSAPTGTDQNRSRFGTAVLLVAGRAFVGAPGANGFTGTVVVYERQDGAWRETGRLMAGDGTRGSGFGASLAVAGQEIWVGAPNAGGGDGVVYRFAPRDRDRFASLPSIVPDSANTAAWPFGFGSSVSMGDGVGVIGMPTRDFGEGRAAILSRTNNDEWQIRNTVLGDIVPPVSSIASGTECENGTVAVFPCSNMEVVSFTPVADLGGERGVWVNDVWGWTDDETGRDYALVARRDGAAFVDLTDPAQPMLVGTLPRTRGSRPSVWRDIKVVNNHAYVVSDGAGAHGMQVFDLTRLRSVANTPVTFTEDAHYDRIFSAHNVVADTASGFMYVVGANGGGETCGGGLHIVDVRQPKSPMFAGCYHNPGGRARGYTHDAQCVVYHGPDERYTGRQICVGSNEVEINIADVTNKDEPVLIGRNSYPNVAYAHQGWFDETQRYFYMGDEGDEVAGLVDGSRTLVWDLSELDDPVLVREYIAAVRSSDHNLFIRGNRAYLSNYGSGLRVLDISDPTDPREVAYFDSAPLGNDAPGMSSAQSGAWSNYPFFENGLVVFTSVREGLFVVRVTPPALIP